MRLGDVRIAEVPGFGASTGYGCVYGSVGTGTVSVEVGGYINDGGCLAVFGH